MSDSDDEAVEKQVKVVILGEASTGKTCLISRYCHNDFSRQYFPTAGVDFFLKRTLLSGARNITLKIWDVGGIALAGNMLDKYLFGANVIILVYDVTNPVSFECLEDWLEAIRSLMASHTSSPMITIVGNKCKLDTLEHNTHLLHNCFCIATLAQHNHWHNHLQTLVTWSTNDRSVPTRTNDSRKSAVCQLTSSRPARARTLRRPSSESLPRRWVSACLAPNSKTNSR